MVECQTLQERLGRWFLTRNECCVCHMLCHRAVLGCAAATPPSCMVHADVLLTISRLLRGASVTHGRTPAAAAMLQAAAALAAQQQQSAVAASGGQQQQQAPSEQQQDLLPLAAAHRLEGTWHGPGTAGTTAAGDDTAAAGGTSPMHSAKSFSVAAAARQFVVDERAEALRDRSWHGSTSLMRSLSEADGLPGAGPGGAKRASERQEFLRFLEAAKRQRQEQRKVARLVLEGSTHGGVQYFLPARATCSVPAGQQLEKMRSRGAGGGGQGDGCTRAMEREGDGDDSSDGEEEEEEAEDMDQDTASGRWPSASAGEVVVTCFCGLAGGCSL